MTKTLRSEFSRNLRTKTRKTTQIFVEYRRGEKDGKRDLRKVQFLIHPATSRSGPFLRNESGILSHRILNTGPTRPVNIGNLVEFVPLHEKEVRTRRNRQ